MLAVRETSLRHSPEPQQVHVNASVFFLAWHDPIALTALKTLRRIIMILARSIHTLHRILNTEVIVIHRL
jgi:hypothetical protein